MRICLRCKDGKEDNEFHKHYRNKKKTRFNFSSYCKTCANILNKEYREKNKERLAEKRKNRIVSEREKIGVSIKNGFAVVDAQEKKKREKCRQKAISLRKKGEIISPGYCQVCGIQKQILDMHHANYEIPESVVFLCRSCHLKIHWNVLNDKIR